MYRTEVLKRAVLQELIAEILQLDRINMASILSASGMDFPESRRLAILMDPGTTVVQARADDRLAAYVEFAPDAKFPGGIYVSSLQVDARYRRGFALPSVLARMALVLKVSPPTRIRVDVQRVNGRALSLFARLGFEIQEVDPQIPTLPAIAGPEVLESDLFQRLSRRFPVDAA